MAARKPSLLARQRDGTFRCDGAVGPGEDQSIADERTRELAHRGPDRVPASQAGGTTGTGSTWTSSGSTGDSTGATEDGRAGNYASAEVRWFVDSNEQRAQSRSSLFCAPLRGPSRPPP